MMQHKLCLVTQGLAAKYCKRLVRPSSSDCDLQETKWVLFFPAILPIFDDGFLSQRASTLVSRPKAPPASEIRFNLGEGRRWAFLLRFRAFS